MSSLISQVACKPFASGVKSLCVVQGASSLSSLLIPFVIASLLSYIIIVTKLEAVTAAEIDYFIFGRCEDVMYTNTFLLRAQIVNYAV